MGGGSFELKSKCPLNDEPNVSVENPAKGNVKWENEGKRALRENLCTCVSLSADRYARCQPRGSLLLFSFIFFSTAFFFTRFFSFFASNFCSLPVLCVSSFVYPSPLLLCFISHSVFMKLFEFRVCVGAVVVAVAVAAALAFLPFQRPPTHTVVVYTVWLSHRIVQRLSQRDKTRIFLCEVGPPRQSHKTREKLGPRAWRRGKVKGFFSGSPRTRKRSEKKTLRSNGSFFFFLPSFAWLYLVVYRSSGEWKRVRPFLCRLLLVFLFHLSLSLSLSSVLLPSAHPPPPSFTSTCRHPPTAHPTALPPVAQSRSSSGGFGPGGGCYPPLFASSSFVDFTNAPPLRLDSPSLACPSSFFSESVFFSLSFFLPVEPVFVRLQRVFFVQLFIRDSYRRETVAMFIRSFYVSHRVRLWSTQRLSQPPFFTNSVPPFFCCNPKKI